MKKLRELDVGVVGTARFKKSWPPKQLKELTSDQVNFNEFHYCIDEHGTLLGRWMDNSLVFCVSTVHKVGKVIKRMRKRPRINQANKRHVQDVWGENGKKEIKIPTIIDDYNHWMLGVDLIDQFIAYYHPNLRCRRNWIPMFIQIVSMIRSNCFIVHKHGNQAPLSHKDFTLEMIRALLNKATQLDLNTAAPTRPIDSILTPTKTVSVIKLRKRKTTCTDNFDIQWPYRNESNHKRMKIEASTNGTCVYCIKEKLEERDRCRTTSNTNKIDWNKGLGRTKYVCKECTEKSSTGSACFLCKKHMDAMHPNGHAAHH